VKEIGEARCCCCRARGGGGDARKECKGGEGERGAAKSGGISGEREKRRSGPALLSQTREGQRNLLVRPVVVSQSPRCKIATATLHMTTTANAPTNNSLVLSSLCFATATVIPSLRRNVGTQTAVIISNISNKVVVAVIARDDVVIEE
jgi:hypothetical protein